MQADAAERVAGSNLRGPSVRELPAVPADEQAFRDGKRFARHYQLDATTGCWTWTTTLRAGHGQFRVGGRTVSAAAWAWERRNGPLPGGRVVEAHLRQRRLRNPDHALAVPPRELVGGKERAKTHCPQGHPYDAQKDLNDARRKAYVPGLPALHGLVITL